MFAQTPLKLSLLFSLFVAHCTPLNAATRPTRVHTLIDAPQDKPIDELTKEEIAEEIPKQDGIENFIENTEQNLDTEVIAAEEKPCPPHISEVPHHEQAAHAVLPTCLDLLQNVAEIVLDPHNPAVVGPSVLDILSDIAILAQSLMHGHGQNADESKDLEAQCLKLKQQLEQHLHDTMIVKQAKEVARTLQDPTMIKRAHSHHECPECAKEEVQEIRELEYEKDAEIIIANILNMVNGFAHIVREPNNPDVVTVGITNMIGSILHLGFHLMKHPKHDSQRTAMQTAHRLHR